MNQIDEMMMNAILRFLRDADRQEHPTNALAMDTFQYRSSNMITKLLIRTPFIAEDACFLVRFTHSPDCCRLAS